MRIKKINVLIKPYTPVIFWVLIAVVTYLLLMEQTGTAPSIPHLDKIVHAIIFASLTFTGYLAYRQQLFTLCLGLICYGAMTEVLQGALTQTRYASVLDWLADLTGILLCMLVVQWVHSPMKQNNVR